MVDFKIQPTFPMATIIDAAVQKPVREAAIQQANRESLIKGLQSISGGLSDVINHKLEMAKALSRSRALADNPAVQGLLTGGNRPVASTPLGPVTLDQTAQGGSDLAPTPNIKKIPAEAIAQLLGKTEPLDFLKAAYEREAKLKPAEDVIAVKDAAGNILRYEHVQHERGGKTLLSSPQPEPKPSKTVDPMEREIIKAKVQLAKTRPMVNSVISEITRVEGLNDNSYGGKIGATQMAARSALEMGTDDPKFKNTADVINTMQQQVAKVLKSTFGGQLSDSERAYLNTVYGALPNMSRAERAIAMKNVKTMLQAKLDGDQATVNELLSDAGYPAQNPVAAPVPEAEVSKQTGGFSAEKKARLEFLRKKKAAGTLGKS